MTHEHEEAGVTPVVSEYLQAIYNLEMEGEPAHAAALARKFGKSRANVSSLLERMRKAGLVSSEGRGDIQLTVDGRRQAELALRRHRLAERYLVDALGLDWITAHEEAHHFELGMTPIVEAAILTPLGRPLEVICVTEVVEDETATLRYVGEKGLRPGRRFIIEDKSPDQAALQLKIDGGRTATVSTSLAQLIWVRAA